MSGWPGRAARHCLIALALVVVAVSGTRAARAAEHLEGIVLMTPSAHEIVVHHAAFADMPAMTMTFRLTPALPVHPGDRISADVDRSTEPWTLRAVRVVGSEMTMPHPPDSPLVKTGDRVPDAAFVDQQGRALTLRALRGKPLAVTFVYTRCTDPAMCPLISAKFRAIQRRLSRSAALVEISLDPAYDRPPVLARYAASYGADARRWHLVTGDPRTVLAFAARFGILEHSAGPVTIVHSERLAIVDRDGRVIRFFDNAAWSPDDVLGWLSRQTAGAHPPLGT